MGPVADTTVAVPDRGVTTPGVAQLGRADTSPLAEAGAVPGRHGAELPADLLRRPTADGLTAESLLRSRRPPPSGGWRRAVYRASAGRVAVGPSSRQRRLAALAARAGSPIVGCHRVAVISLKGGVGKTTTTAAVGATLADLRTDRVVAVDANPDRGTLGEKVAGTTTATVRDLLAVRAQVHRYTDVRACTAVAPSRLEVLASAADPGLSQAFGEGDYLATLDILERFYSLVLTDCGTGLLHSAMRGVLSTADQLVVVSTASLDGARCASATLDWLAAHGHARLAARSVAVICAVRRGGEVDLARLRSHFGQRCRAVHTVPFDRHLAAGATVELDRLAPGTRQAYLAVAASLGDGFH